jgi:ABC-type glycerol-3-phosphate transport system permease component
VTAHRFGRVLSYIVLIVIGLVGLLPFLYLLLLSTKSRLDILEVPPSLDFDWATIKANYAEVIHEDGYFTFVKNSVIVTGVSTLIALVLGVPAGYAFSRLRFRGSDTWGSTILSFRFMPPVAVAIPIYLMIRYVGLLDGYPGLILPYIAFTLPLVVWIMIGFFDEIPREIDEAAMVDGLTRPFVLLKVLLPLARPGILVAATFGVIFIWNEFLVGLYVINSQDHYTIPIAASSLLTVESPIDWNIAAATGIFTVIPILLFSIVVQRYIVRGITAGAVR